jgi:hypothetical protein
MEMSGTTIVISILPGYTTEVCKVCNGSCDFSEQGFLRRWTATPFSATKINSGKVKLQMFSSLSLHTMHVAGCCCLTTATFYSEGLWARIF